MSRYSNQQHHRSNSWLNHPAMNHPLGGCLGFIGIVLILYLLITLGEMCNPIKNKSAEFSMSTSELLYAFKENEAAANAKYKDKIINVSGIVTEIGESSVTLDENVICNISDNDGMEKIQTLRKGSLINVKGKCDGKWLWTVHLDMCVIK